MKFCKDCIHFSEYSYALELSRCKLLKPKTEIITSCVSGESVKVIKGTDFCSSLRTDLGECGPSARHYVEKTKDDGIKPFSICGFDFFNKK